jgi:hypothetical protein
VATGSTADSGETVRAHADNTTTANKAAITFFILDLHYWKIIEISPEKSLKKIKFTT